MPDQKCSQNGRLNSDGTLDYTFNIGVGADNIVYVMSQASDGTIITGGTFRKFDGQDHIGIAKINTSSAIYDFDGNGKSDISVYRPESGIWYILKSRDGFFAVQFGNSTDKPVVGDYDGDGKSDVAIYRPETGVWYLMQSRDGIKHVQFGLPTDLPTPADYDGDGRTDISVFRPSENIWYQQKSTEGFNTVLFGVNGDKPVPNSFVP